QRLDHEPKELLVTSRRELERARLGHNRICLRRPTCTWSAAPGPPDENRLQNPQRDEAFETPARDGAREVERCGEVVGAGRISLAAAEPPRRAQIRVANGVPTVHRVYLQSR